MPTTVERLLPTEEAGALLELTREIAAKELEPHVHDAEEAGEFPADVYRVLGRSGLLSLPYAEEHGGGAQPYEVYLQVLEEIVRRLAQRRGRRLGARPHRVGGRCPRVGATSSDAWLPGMLCGDWLGAYCLSEPHAGSDVERDAARARSATATTTSSPAPRPWISNGGVADFYRCSPAPPTTQALGLSSLPRAGRHRRADVRPARAEDGPALRRRPRTVLFDGRPDPGRPAPRRGGRRAADRARRARLRSARHRRGRHRPRAGRARRTRSPTPASASRSAGRSSTSRGCSSCSPTWRPSTSSAPGRRTSTPHGSRTPAVPFARQASIAKLVATDAAMKVTTDAVQVLGGYGYTRDFPVERLHARGQGDADLRGHQPDPADGDRARPVALMRRRRAVRRPRRHLHYAHVGPPQRACRGQSAAIASSGFAVSTWAM